MKSEFMYSVSSQPINLGADFSALIWTQANVFGLPTISPAALNRLLIDAFDLTTFDQQTLQSQRRLYDAGHVPRETRALLHWAQQRVLRGKEVDARTRIMDLLGIVLLEGTVACLLELNAHDPQLVTYLLEGRIGSAIRHVPKQGYPDGDDEQSWTAERVMDLITIVLRLWIANDLQLEAAATHVRIFRPTGCDVLDHVANGWPIIQSTLIARIEKELDLYF